MTRDEKCHFLNELVLPLGYCYDCSQDVFSSTPDAWQKKYGYGSIYDRMAPFFNMIFDCKPIYFDYDRKTWLIEFWKGQYGINTGSEIGVYHADRIISPSERSTTIFSAVDAEEYLNISMELFHKGTSLGTREKSHWWLTIFSMGHFANPEELSMKISIRFPDFEMRNAFMDALYLAGYNMDTMNLSLYYTDVSFTFVSSGTSCHLPKKIYRSYVQWKNKRFCRLYGFVTRPFFNTCDKLLYLYFYLPFIFRRMLRLKRFHRREMKRK
ncbi:MAG: DUF4474 domain-containing protein [Lachnospiraceae bacterium]|nr:DUF4474 domain-containing protein [Lachnospiraceae bacterium]